MRLTRRAGAARRLRGAPRSRSRDLARAHREAVAALSRDATAIGGRRSPGCDGSALAEVFDDIAASPAAADLTVAPGDYARPVRAPPSPTAWCGGRIAPACACASSGRSRRGSPRSTAWCSAGSSKAPGRRMPAAIPGSAADAARSSASICRSGASAFRRMISRSCWARREVILTRAAKLAGAPTVASRFVQRLAAVAGEARWSDAVARGERYLALGAHARSRRRASQPAQRPEPKPPRAARPTRALGHRHRALAARPLHDLRQAHSAAARRSIRSTRRQAPADRGTVIHGAIGDFTEQFAAASAAPTRWPNCSSSGATHFAALDDYPEARAFWWPRFERIARWFADWEQRAARRHRRRCMPRSAARSTFRSASGTFRLSARADRIERLARRRLRDPRLQDRRGADREAGAHRASRRSSRWKPRSCVRGGFQDIAAGASDRRARLCDAQGRRAGRRARSRSTSRTAARQPGRPTRWRAHRARRRASRTRRRRIARWCSRCGQTRYGDYDHLARVKEWSVTGGAEDEMPKPNERAPHSRAVRREQTEASDPQVSAWVSANAGSGKTHVLAQRVIRLLLAGTDPAKILCITFTKAAAANMATRVFEHARGVDRARRCGARRARSARSSNEPARSGAARAARGGCSPGAGNAGRAEGADHPRLLHAPAAAVPVRGQCGGALHGARRCRRQRSCSSELDLAVLLDAAARRTAPLGRALAAAIAAAADQTFRDVVAKRSASATRSTPGSNAPAASTRRSRACRARSASTRLRLAERRRRDRRWRRSVADAEWPAVAAALRGGLEDRSGPGRSARPARDRAPASERVEAYLKVFCTEQARCRARALRHAARSQTIIRTSRATDGRAGARLRLLDAPQRAIACRDRTAALLTIAGDGARPLSRREGAPRPARLR